MSLSAQTSARALARSPSIWLLAALLVSLSVLAWVGYPITRGTARYLPATAHRAFPTATTAESLPAAAIAAARSLASAPAGALAALRGAPGAQDSTGPETVHVVVGRNDTLGSIFHRLQVSRADLETLRHLPGLEQDLDRLRPGETLTLVHLGRELMGLTRRMSLAETLTVERIGSGFRARVIENPLRSRVRTVSGTIDRSLFEAMAEAGGHEQTALALGSLFAWDIDFLNDLRPGDSFTVTYTEVDQNGRYAEDGPILAARFVNRGREYLAVRYAAPGGKAAYYTPNGRNLRKAFLRFPLAFTRVSSPFNLHRFHPILHRIRAHTGVDYAAPLGTPVHAVGDGKVAFVGRKGGYGNAVEIDHGHGITTLYGHLSRFAHGIRSGLRVTQGEVIAFVGMTGLATGPHLHYEYRVNGVYKNPQTVSLPDAVPITPALRAEFLAKTAPLLASLFPAAGPALVSR